VRLIGLRRSISWNTEFFRSAARKFEQELDVPEDAFAPAFVFLVLGQSLANVTPEIRQLAEIAFALSRLETAGPPSGHGKVQR
jgi:hypothetical protein